MSHIIFLAFTHWAARTVWIEVCVSKGLLDGSQEAGRVQDVYEFRRTPRDPVGGEGKHGS